MMVGPCINDGHRLCCNLSTIQLWVGLGQILGSLLDDYGRSYRMVVSVTLWFLFLHFLFFGGRVGWVGVY